MGLSVALMTRDWDKVGAMTQALHTQCASLTEDEVVEVAHRRVMRIALNKLADKTPAAEA